MKSSSPEMTPMTNREESEVLFDTHALFVINAQEKRVQIVRKTSRIYQSLKHKPHVTGTKDACDAVSKCIFD